MFCSSCGKEIPDNSKFCSGCGTKIIYKNYVEETEVKENLGEEEKSKAIINNRNDNDDIVNHSLEKDNVVSPNRSTVLLASIVFAAVFLYIFIDSFFPGIRGIFRAIGCVFDGEFLNGLIRLCLSLTSLALGAVSILIGCIAVFKALKWRDDISYSYFLTLESGGVIYLGIIILKFIIILFDMVINHLKYAIGHLSFALIWGIVFIIATYGVMILIGCKPDVPKDLNALKEEVISSIKSSLKELTDAYHEKYPNTKKDKSAKTNIMNNEPAPSVGRKLKTNRSLLGYIVFNVMTCGIYGIYFQYKIAKDLNIVCKGDDEKTAGFIKFALLSIITCSIYIFWWQYKVGNRLQANAPRYGLSFSESGASVLAWRIFGSLICFIGPFISMHIIIKNTNKICAAYNNYYASVDV